MLLIFTTFHYRMSNGRVYTKYECHTLSYTRDTTLIILPYVNKVRALSLYVQIKNVCIALNGRLIEYLTSVKTHVKNLTQHLFTQQIY
jgi:hypothetical protein